MEDYQGGFEGYWKRNRYQRLDPGGGSAGWRWRTQRRPRVELASAVALPDGGRLRRRRRRVWRIKVAPKLGFLRRAAASPGRILAGIRDAYVRMMLRLANSRVFSAGAGLGYYGGDAGALAFGRPYVKEYDEKMILEIYKSVMAQGHLFAATAGGNPQPGAMVPRRLN